MLFDASVISKVIEIIGICRVKIFCGCKRLERRKLIEQKKIEVMQKAAKQVAEMAESNLNAVASTATGAAKPARKR